MRVFLPLVASGLCVVAVALPAVPGQETKAASSYTATSKPQSAARSTPNYKDYGPEVVYAKPWPTTLITTTTPHATVSAPRVERRIAEPTHTAFPAFFNTPFDKLVKTRTAPLAERTNSEPTKGLEDFPAFFNTPFDELVKTRTATLSERHEPTPTKGLQDFPDFFNTPFDELVQTQSV